MSSTECYRNLLVAFESQAVFPIDEHLHGHDLRVAGIVAGPYPGLRLVELRDRSLVGKEVRGRHGACRAAGAVAERSVFEVFRAFDEHVGRYVLCRAGADVAEHERAGLEVCVDVPVDVFGAGLTFEQLAVQFVNLL